MSCFDTYLLADKMRHPKIHKEAVKNRGMCIKLKNSGMCNEFTCFFIRMLMKDAFSTYSIRTHYLDKETSQDPFHKCSGRIIKEDKSFLIYKIGPCVLLRHQKLSNFLFH